MGRKLINVRDKIVASEQSHNGGFAGRVIFGRGKHLVPFIDPFGHQSFRTEFDEVLYDNSNIVTIGGYQFAFDKMFNIGLDQETTLRVGDLNDEAPQMKIGVQRSQYKSNLYTGETGNTVQLNNGINISAMNYIFGFMIGDGGAREDGATAIAPDYKNRGLFHAVPFRMSNDGHSVEPNKYYGKTTTAAGATGLDPITSYYVKKFDNPAPHIVHCWIADSDEEMQIVDDSVFASTSSVPIESYVEMNISVSQFDGRGYFTSTNSTPRINEFALVSGWFNRERGDYEALRMITHFTRPSITLVEGDSIEAVYRLYAR